ncbi:hypothetical protein ABIE89_007414 [Bradyrhizobium niftali]
MSPYRASRHSARSSSNSISREASASRLIPSRSAARAAVAEVSSRLAAMKSIGELRELNASFKAPRAVDPSLPYAEFFDAKRVALLEVLAKQVNSQR